MLLRARRNMAARMSCNDEGSTHPDAEHDDEASVQWELSKENVLPLARGRDAAQVGAVLKQSAARGQAQQSEALSSFKR